MHTQVFGAICVLLGTATVAQSSRWFAPEVNCWITQEKVPALWEDARRFCEIDDAVLASPLNIKLLDYMQTLINEHNHSVPYFIGTRARPDYGQKVQYESLEGRRVDDLPRAVYSEIVLLDPEQGECLAMDRHGIRAVSCWEPLPYICYSNETTECGSAPATTPTPMTSAPTTTTSAPTTTTSAPTTTTSAPTTTTSAPTTTTSAPLPSTTIPPGYTHYSTTGSFYKFHNKHTVTWHSANTSCASEGARLVVVNNADEANIIWRIVTDAVGGKCAWTGLRNNRPGGVMDWRSVNGVSVSELFNDWGNSGPHNDAARTCGLYCAHNKLLFDYSCDYTAGDLYFICEIPQ